MLARVGLTPVAEGLIRPTVLNIFLFDFLALGANASVVVDVTLMVGLFICRGMVGVSIWWNWGHRMFSYRKMDSLAWLVKRPLLGVFGQPGGL